MASSKLGLCSLFQFWEFQELSVTHMPDFRCPDSVSLKKDLITFHGAQE